MTRQRNITLEQLQDIYICNPETGKVFRKYKSKEPRKVVLKPNNKGYIVHYFYIDGTRYSFTEHRLIFFFANKYQPDEVDHINGNKSDNRISNLRAADRFINCRNTKKRSDNSSGISGVSFRKDTQKWVAAVSVNGKKKYLGSFKDKEDAIAARKLALSKLSGYSDRHGL